MAMRAAIGMICGPISVTLGASFLVLLVALLVIGVTSGPISVLRAVATAFAAFFGLRCGASGSGSVALSVF
jgi:hypothetical protein